MSTLRITAGALRGRRIPVPPGGLRPTSERARQGFFNIAAPRLQGSRFLDLFAGSGVFAFEAVSRGAAAATAVDADPRNIEGIARRAKEWSAPVNAVSGDVLKVLPRLGRSEFDLVYADPPYDYPDYDELLAGIDEHLRLSAGALVGIEHRRRSDPFTRPARHLKKTRRAEYGEVWITLFERSDV